MKKTFILSMMLAGSLLSCDTTKEEPAPDSPYQQEGFILSSDIETSAGFTTYVGYFKDLASMANVDMSKQSTYTRFYTFGTNRNLAYGMSTSGDQKFSQLAVSKTDGTIKEVKSIPLLGFSFFNLILNDNLGIITQTNTTDLLMFNPTSMENLGTIDMSKAKKITANERNTYYSGVYRKSDNRLFMFLHSDNFNTGAFYDATDVYVEVINLTTKAWEKTITYKNAQYPISRGKENAVIDESGNIFVTCQGSYGLDGKLGPLATKDSRPQILKISAATNDFDPSYSFNPVDKLGLNSLLIQLMGGTIYDANGIAYACVSAQQESPRILQLVQKLAMGTITETEYLELRMLVFYSPSQRWSKLDLNAQTVTVLNDIPITAGFGYPNSYKYDGKFYFQYNDGKNSGYYEYVPSTGKATKVVTIAAGGIAAEFIKLAK